MASKILAQSAPAAATSTNMYACRENGRANAESMTVCNRGSTDDRVRVSISLLGATVATKDYLYYDLLVQANDSFAAALGWVIPSTAVVRVYSTTGNSSFTMFGDEAYPA